MESFELTQNTKHSLKNLKVSPISTSHWLVAHRVSCTLSSQPQRSEHWWRTISLTPYCSPFSALGRDTHDTRVPQGRRRELTCVSCSVTTACKHTYMNTPQSKQVSKHSSASVCEFSKKKCALNFISQTSSILVTVWKSAVELEKALEYRVWCCHGFRHPLQPWNLSPTGRGGYPVPKSEIIESYDITMAYCWEAAGRLAKVATPVSIPVSNTQRFWLHHILPNVDSGLLVTALSILRLWGGFYLIAVLMCISCWLMIPRLCLLICFCHCWPSVYLWGISRFAPMVI